MAKIGISLDGVVRNFVEKLLYTYEKYYPKIDLDVDEITDHTLMSHFPFKTEFDRDLFLYVDAPLELFGHPGEMELGIINKLNDFVAEQKYQENQVVIREIGFDRAIPGTLFFLSKYGAKVNDIRLGKKNDLWAEIDIMITANPDILELKPEGKITIKVNRPYNTNSASDYSIDSITELVEDPEFINNVLNTQTTNYEDIE